MYNSSKNMISLGKYQCRLYLYLLAIFIANCHYQVLVGRPCHVTQFKVMQLLPPCMDL